MLNMWFVEVGARVEEWDKLCEMQSDKAAIEISANYSGIVRKLYAQTDDMVKTGAALVDIEDSLPEKQVFPSPSKEYHGHGDRLASGSSALQESSNAQLFQSGVYQHDKTRSAEIPSQGANRGAKLATPAVRSLLKEHEIDIAHVEGTGKDGRISKKDVLNHVKALAGHDNSSSISTQGLLDQNAGESLQPLTPVQSQMYRTMTASLQIPHFLFADEVNVTQLSALRKRLNSREKAPQVHLTLLAFILKAISIALDQFPILNACVDARTDPTKPKLLFRRYHNIGIAMDTPSGLLVPVIRNVATLSILEIAKEITRLSELGQARKLSNADLSGGTISVSNIGNIGGTVVAPVLVEKQVAILGVGKSRPVPVFGESGAVEKAEVANFSWSADHRVIDGATMARMASAVKSLLEEPGIFMTMMR